MMAATAAVKAVTVALAENISMADVLGRTAKESALCRDRSNKV